MFVADHYKQTLAELGLTSLDRIKTCRGEPVTRHGDRREVIRLTADGNPPVTFFLKRSWHAHLKDGLASILRRGRVWSAARVEWDNSEAVARAGFPTAELVAYGEEIGPLKARFSFILTRSARGSQTLFDFLTTCHDPAERRRVLSELATRVRQMHAAGLYYPDLFSRHVFIDTSVSPPALSLIDVARLDRRKGGSDAMRARDVAALNASVPVRYASATERLRFLREYTGAGRADRRRFVGLIRKRMQHLLTRSKFRDFATPAPAARPAPIG
jgi:hypothetical protein